MQARKAKPGLETRDPAKPLPWQAERLNEVGPPGFLLRDRIRAVRACIVGLHFVASRPRQRHRRRVNAS